MNNKAFYWLLLIGILAIYSCDKEPNENDIDPTDPNEEMVDPENNDSRELLEGESVLKIRLTDGPIDLQAVNLDIVGMYIIADSSRHQLSTVQGIYNLLDFQNGLDTLISVDTFSISFLKDLIFELGDNNTVVDNEGVEHPLELPSANRDFLTIKFNQRLDSLDLLDVQIDFDACKSVHETGNGRWILKPVIKINRINDRRPVDDIDTTPDKLDQILAANPGFEIEDIDRKAYCFTDEILIKVELGNEMTDEEKTLILNSDCVELFEVQKVDIADLGTDITDAAMDGITGNADLFKMVDSYVGPNGNSMFGFTAMKGQGNSGKQVDIFIDGDSMLICTE